jgi:hypothetical protein
MRSKSMRSRKWQFPITLDGLIEAGGPETLVRHAAEEAAESAARIEREFWLGVLEGVVVDGDDDVITRSIHESYIRDLRRKLGIRPPKEVIREQTRERVRRYRERRLLPRYNHRGLPR